MASQFFAPVTGGEERMVEDLSRALARRGHDVAVMTMTDGSASIGDGVRVHRLRSLAGRLPGLHADGARRHLPPVPDPEAAMAVGRVIRRECPDLVHAHNWLVHSALPAVARRRLPLVLTLHDYGLVCPTKRLVRDGRPCAGPQLGACLACAGTHYGRAKGTATVLALRAGAPFLRRVADLMLPISRAVAARSGLAAAGIPHRVIPDFIPDDLLAEAPARPRPAGLPDGEYLAFGGDLARDKGIDVLFAAYRALDRPPPLVLVGRELAHEPVAPPPGVVVLGRRPHAELMEVFRRSLAVIVPSVWEEPFGLVALEGMAAGRPVVASRTGGLADIIRDGESGLLVPPGDPGALAKAITAVVGSPALREQLGAAARRRARELTESRIVPLVEDAYRSVLARAPGGARSGTA